MFVGAWDAFDGAFLQRSNFASPVSVLHLLPSPFVRRARAVSGGSLLVFLQKRGGSLWVFAETWWFAAVFVVMGWCRIRPGGGSYGWWWFFLTRSNMRCWWWL
ncbi:hypothetical protein QL285_084275 [Trifolium repens]|nr:hypothetical protein QL285_084275 [Trifolium repens]